MNLFRSPIGILIIFLSLHLHSNQTSAQDILPLWEDRVPGALGTEAKDSPTLTAYWAADPVGSAVVICPGGGYTMLAMDHEGHQVARWFQEQGVHAFVLTYRLGSDGYHHPIMMWDGLRAVRMVRSMADAQGFNPQHIGIMGFSAGGHLAATVSNNFDPGQPDSTDLVERFSSRPDFTILAYPVISMLHPIVHKGSRSALMGDRAEDFDLQYLLSAEEQVTDSTPPTFLVHTTTDQVVIPENSIWYYLSLRRAGVPAEMHLYQEGGHGLGMFPEDNPVFATWKDRLYTWMELNSWLGE